MNSGDSLEIFSLIGGISLSLAALNEKELN
jgi:hypothetical protein